MDSKDNVIRQFLRGLLEQHISVLACEYSTWRDGTLLKDIISDIIVSQNFELADNKKELERIVKTVCDYLNVSPNMPVDTWDPHIS